MTTIEAHVPEPVKEQAPRCEAEGFVMHFRGEALLRGWRMV